MRELRWASTHQTSNLASSLRYDVVAYTNSREHRGPEYNWYFESDKSCTIVHEEIHHERCGVLAVCVSMEPSTSVDGIMSPHGSGLVHSSWRTLTPCRFGLTIEGGESVFLHETLPRNPERLEYILRNRL